VSVIEDGFKDGFKGVSPASGTKRFLFPGTLTFCANCTIVFSHVSGTTSAFADRPLPQRDVTPITL
jgi:hypothetical protein